MKISLETFSCIAGGSFKRRTLALQPLREVERQRGGLLHAEAVTIARWRTQVKQIHQLAARQSAARQAAPREGHALSAGSGFQRQTQINQLQPGGWFGGVQTGSAEPG